MHAIAKSGVFIAGMGGLGAEIGKFSSDMYIVCLSSLIKLKGCLLYTVEFPAEILSRSLINVSIWF